MKKFAKKVLVGVMLMSAMSAIGVPVAANANSYNCVVTDENGVKSYRYIPGAADETATPDDLRSARSLVITGSDVWLTIWYTTNDHFYFPSYGAEGFVTSAQYHYARAEVWDGTNTSMLVGPQRYGVGQVWSATTNNGFPAVRPNNPRARVFYGN